jgi:putative redox protein
MQTTMDVVFPGGLRVNSLYRGFTIETDQDKESGGQAAAPEPFDLFLASIGTCAGIYVLRFCEQRSIATDGMKIHLEINKSEEKRMVESIVITILPPPGFPEKYRAAIVKAAGLCSVKKHLANPPAIDIRTA